MPAVARFPADLALRRQLWRQWVRFDAPQGEHGRAMPARTAKRVSPRRTISTRVYRTPAFRVLRQTVRPAPQRSVAGLVSVCVALESIIVAGVMLWLRA